MKTRLTLSEFYSNLPEGFFNERTVSNYRACPENNCLKNMDRFLGLNKAQTNQEKKKKIKENQVNNDKETEMTKTELGKRTHDCIDATLRRKELLYRDEYFDENKWIRPNTKAAIDELDELKKRWGETGEIRSEDTLHYLYKNKNSQNSVLYTGRVDCSMVSLSEADARGYIIDWKITDEKIESDSCHTEIKHYAVLFANRYDLKEVHTYIVRIWDGKVQENIENIMSETDLQETKREIDEMLYLDSLNPPPPRDTPKRCANCNYKKTSRCSKYNKTW